ncbi:ionotropic receptor 93a [Chrysoperla carnea]|uniref:ionotropic receptor 93a n=1 Tax=Chrysoperla carnea TaxID=189513 RepID=UPI001D089FEF|nr:ionotropic receptor 93a [Chrysoperla carnea]
MQIRGLPLKQVGRNFLVIVQLDIMATILEIAKTLQMTTPKSQWLYIICDMDSNQNVTTYSNLLGEGENIAFIYNSTITSNECVQGIENQTVDVLRGFMTALDSAVREEEETSSQIPDEEWEAVRPTKEQRRDFLLKTLRQHLSQYGVNGNCTRWKLQSGETWGLQYEQKNESTDIQLLDVGYWRPSDGLNLNDVLFPHVEHGFRGRTLPLVSFHNPPWQVLKLNETGSVVEYSGVIFHIIEEISKKLNFTFTIVFPDGHRIGLAANETYNPSTIKGINIDNARRIVNESNRIIEVLRKRSVLMAACAVTVNNQRKHIINYTMPISTETYTFLVSRPKELSRALLFLSPFALDTWLCLGIAVASMGPILYFIHKFSPVYEYTGLTQSGGLSTIHNCLWYMYGALMQQGGMYLPSADSGRLIVGTWWLVVLVVVTTYSGNLVAFLTFPKIDSPINTINDLLTHRDTVTWSILHGTSLEEFLKTTDEPKLEALHKGVLLKDEVDTKMLDEITAGRHVFIDWKINLQFVMKKEFLRTNRCDLTLSSDEFLEEQVAMIVSKGNPYLPMINEQIKRLHQVGLIEKWLTDYLPKKDRCSNIATTTEVKNHTVNMNDMQGSFFVLFLGFICAAFVIIIEKLWKKRVISKEQKVIQPFMS